MSRIRGIFAQVYVHGLLLLAAVVVSSLLVTFLVSGNQRREEIAEASNYIHDQIVERWEDPERMERELRRQARSFKFSASIFDREGRSLARAGRRPPRALNRRQQDRLEGASSVIWVGRAMVAIPLRRSGEFIGYAVGRAPMRRRTPVRAIAVLLTVVAMLALVSVPLVKRIVRPLSVIGETARALGDGELGARTGLNRRDEIGDLARAVDEMAEKIERSSRVERELMANVSHELRTPLARLRVALELATDVTPERQAHLLGEALRDIEEMDELTEEILMVARLELGRDAVSIEVTPHDADLWIEDRVARVRRAHPERTIDLETKSLGERFFDSKWLGRALDNLLENAVKYSSGAVTVASIADGSSWTVSVTDRGVGIAPQEMERIYAPFYRVSRGAGGFGLGLTLAKRVVEAHGGTLEVKSELEVGSTFSMHLTR